MKSSMILREWKVEVMGARVARQEPLLVIQARKTLDLLVVEQALVERPAEYLIEEMAAMTMATTILSSRASNKPPGITKTSTPVIIKSKQSF